MLTGKIRGQTQLERTQALDAGGKAALGPLHRTRDTLLATLERCSGVAHTEAQGLQAPGALVPGDGDGASHGGRG